MTSGAIKPEHLLVSLRSLQSICSKKLTDDHLVDNEELTHFCRTVRAAVTTYQQTNNIPELEIVMRRFPEARSYEPIPRALYFTSFLYRVLGILIGVLLPFLFFYAIILLTLWLAGYMFGVIVLYKHRARVNDDLSQISSCCGTISMLISNNETYRED